MSGSPLYFSETFTVGPRTYLMEVRRTLRGQKFFIITRTDVMDDQQQPVIIFDGYMTRFAGAIDRATRAMVNTVAEVEPADERREKNVEAKKKAAKRKKEKPKRESAAETTKTTTTTPTKKQILTQQRQAERAEAKQKAAERKKERPNQGCRWTDEHDSVLIVHYKNGMSTDELAKLLGRGEFSIGVRLLKLGLGQPKA